ncbi:MAG: xanthine dehydrogenase family protein molybdopterin-binding subunit [Actinomycetota bacterium]
MIGQARLRTEDERLITGGGSYLDDLHPDGMVHAVFVRSPVSHGMITDLDLEAARGMPGVLGVFTGADLSLGRPMPDMHPSPLARNSVQGYPLAPEEVCYVGEPVAVVVADDRYRAADAASVVFVDCDPLDACVDHRRALDPGAPMVHRGADSNLVATLTASYGDTEDVFGSAPHVIGVTLSQHRGAAAFIEPRGVLAEPGEDEFMLWSSTQSPHGLRRLLGDYLAIEGLRVAAPDVGGGFGPKGAVYAEEYVVAALGRHLGRPVKWVEGRREHFLATHQQRDQTYHLEVACDTRGRLLGLRGRVIHDNGAYLPYGLLLANTGLNLIPGPYDLGALDIAIDVVYTNLVPTSPIRGAGRPNAVFAMERCVDAVARTLGLDPVEVRRRNFVADPASHTLPLLARNGEPIRYDAGDYAALLDAAVEAADRDGFEVRRKRSEEAGRLRGLGLASYVEDTGLGPSESARVELSDGGTVVVRVGVSSQGQGHATVFAQLAADVMGVDPGEVRVRAGDTGVHPAGISTVASRTAATAGPAVHQAACELAELIKRHASEMLEAAPEDLVLEGGAVKVVGDPGPGVRLGDIAARVVSAGEDPAADRDVPFGQAAYAYGTHVAEVEVDAETGRVEVVAYTVAHDCGPMLNPMIVNGQIDGGVAHGLGNALWERVASDSQGQPLVTTFVDYRIPSAVGVPSVQKVHTQTPSSTNSLGVRGAGEGGTIPAAAAVAAAVEDALSHLGVVVDRYPLGPETVMGLIWDDFRGHGP